MGSEAPETELETSIATNHRQASLDQQKPAYLAEELDAIRTK